MAFVIFDSADKDTDSIAREWFVKLDLFNSNDEIEWNVDENIAYGLLNHKTINTFINSQIIEKTFHRLEDQSHTLNEQILLCIIKAFELMDDDHLIRFVNLPHLFDILLYRMKFLSCNISPFIISKFLSSNALMYHHKETLCKLMHKQQFFMAFYKSDVISPQVKTICSIYRSIMMEHVFGSWKLHDGYFRKISKEMHIAHDVIAVVHRFVGCLYQPKHIVIGGVVQYNNAQFTILDTTVLDAKVCHERAKQGSGWTSNLTIPEIRLNDLKNRYQGLPKKFMVNSLCASMRFTAETNLRIAELMTDDLIENHGALLHDNVDGDWVWLQRESGHGSKTVVKVSEIEKIDCKYWYVHEWLETKKDVIVMSDLDEWRGTKVKVVSTWNEDFAMIMDQNQCQKLILFDFLCPNNPLLSPNATLLLSSEETEESSTTGPGLFADDSSMRSCSSTEDSSSD
eukprot:1160233_1